MLRALFMLLCLASLARADQPESAPALPPPPWAVAPVDRHDVPDVFVAQWKQADNRATCPPLVLTRLGKGEGAHPRGAKYNGGWAVAYDKPGAPGTLSDGKTCDSCGHSAFGIAGADVTKEGPVGARIVRWRDGSFASFTVPPDGEISARLERPDVDCPYYVWTTLGEAHLMQLLGGLRRVAP